MFKNFFKTKLLTASLFCALSSPDGYAVNGQPEVLEVVHGPFIVRVHAQVDPVYLERQRNNMQRLLEMPREEILNAVHHIPVLSANQLPYLQGDGGRLYAYVALTYRIKQVALQNNIKLIMQGNRILNPQGNQDPILQHAMNLIHIKLQELED